MKRHVRIVLCWFLRWSLALSFLEAVRLLKLTYPDVFIRLSLGLVYGLVFAWAAGTLGTWPTLLWWNRTNGKRAESDSTERVNEADSLGQTALFVAAENNYIDSVRLLLAKGANPNIRDNYGRTALEVACRENNIEAVKLLMEHGATCGPRKWSLLMHACHGNQIELVRLLLDCQQSSENAVF